MSSLTQAILDAVGQVASDAITDATYVFAVGATAAVTSAAPEVVALTDDFSELGTPFVTVALGKWSPVLSTTIERLTLEAKCAVWRDRIDLGPENALLLADRDAIAAALIAHTKLHVVDATVQSAILLGGPGIVPVSVPRGTREGAGERLFLTLPFSVEIKADRTVNPQPA